jgi:CubicO group peptidase (beta-lactamase class C family)
MDVKDLTTPKFWYGRRTRRQMLGIAAAGIGAAGFASGLGPFSTSIARAGGVLSPAPIANAAQSGYAWVANHGLDGDAYQAEFDSLSAQGYRLIKISGYSVSGQDYYASIWDMSPGPAWVGMHRVSNADYQSQFNSLTAQGYRPVDISGYEMNGADYYVAIFDMSPMPSWDARHAVAGADYQGIVDANIANGLKPLRVSGYSIGGSDYIACIWITDDGSYGWQARHGLDNASYQAEFDNLTGQGYRPVDISGYELNGTDYYTAIFDTSPKLDWVARHGLTSDEYQSAFDDNAATGYALTHVAGYGVNGEARYAAIWETDTEESGEDIDYGTTTAVDQIAIDAIADAGVPGVSVAIAKDGLLVYARAFGFADAGAGERMTPDHRLRIASVTKPITATAIMQLAEQGVLSTDDQVFGDDGWLGTTYGTQPYSDDLLAITIDHLLTHTSGGWGDRTNDPMFQRTDLSGDDFTSWVIDNFPQTSSPGMTYAYANFGYHLLGRVIESATGQSYESYVAGNTLAGCGITDMQIAGDTLADRASGEVVYDGTNSDIGDPYRIPVRRMDSHGGWIATATDLLRFMVRMDADPTATDIVSRSTLTTMTTGTTANANYGRGWSLYLPDNNWFHDGLLGGTAAIMVRHSTGICYAVITNGNGLDTDKLGRDMAYAVDDWGAGTPL